MLKGVMKTKIGLAGLALLSVGLAIALIVFKKQADEKQANDASTILDFSNQLYHASTSLNDLRQVNLTLNSDLATNHLVLSDLSNNLAAVSQSATNIQLSLTAAQDQLNSQSNRIADLQAQNKVLDDRATQLTEQATALTNTIALLNGKIDLTVQQLANSQTNNAFLEQQLQDLVEMKAELEHKFNTLEIVRAQVRKLRQELVEARRLRWMKEGVLMQRRGAEWLTHQQETSQYPALSTNYGLNVEIGSDGSVRALPRPGLTPTNAPTANSPATNSPAK